jgi:surface protein
MRDEGWSAARNNPDHDGGIHTAVNLRCRDPAAAKARYGPIASWDTSGVTDMEWLFAYKRDFNEDISRWNVSNVVNMSYTFYLATSFNGDLSRWNVSNVVNMVSTFYGATSFNGDLSGWDVGQVRNMGATFANTTSFDRQLGGAWATSTASKTYMFDNSPGTIAGKTKDADGTIA